jgi:peptide/nickel transport system permease protein
VIWFLARRLASMVVVLLVLAAVVFVLQDISPVEPVRASVGEDAPQSVVAAARKKLGYDNPLPQRYVDYIGDALHGNLQTSLRTHQPVASDIGEYLPASIELVLAALVIGVPLSLAFGIAGALRTRGSGVLRTGLFVAAAAPPFLLGILGILIFYRDLGWLPASGRTSLINPPTGPTGLIVLDGLLHGEPQVTLNSIEHLIMPAFALALVPSVSVGRVLRGSLIASLRTEQVRAARSRGLSSWQIVLRHCLRNSAGPSLAMGGLMFGVLFSSLTLVETVFAWPGIGLYVAQSIPSGDFPAIGGVTLLLGACYVMINTAVDLLQGLADPRIRQ